MSWTQITNARRKGEANANSLLERVGALSAPMPVKEIAVAEGCQLKSTILEDDLSGMAFIKDGQKFIVYNASHHPNRQRFTIAHELGHHLMDASMLKNSVHVDRGVLRRDNVSAGGTEPKEIAANAFAACLLMPEALVRSLCPGSMDLEDDSLVHDLSRRFGVSPAAFTNRLLNLSLA